MAFWRAARPLLVTPFFLLPLAASAETFDWPQWQGPDRNAVSRETGLLQTWPANGPRLVWKAKGLGEGFGTPSVAGGTLYTMGNLPGRNGQKTEYVLALYAKDGKPRWATPVGPVRSGGGGYPGPRCTPTVDGNFVYALGLGGDLLCLRADTGRVQWRKDLPGDFGGSVGGWGYSESPLIDGDKLICTPGGRRATLLALHKKTGKPFWQCPVPEGDAAAYSSVVAGEVDGKRLCVQFLSDGVVGVDAETGKFLWRYDRPANGTANCSTPILQDGHVFAASDYGTGGGLVRLTRDGGEVSAEEVYFTREMRNHHGGMVLVDGHLYGDNGGQLTCLDFKTGKVKWKSRDAGKGSITLAEGRLYYRQEGGPMLLIRATPNACTELGRFEQPDESGQPTWPHPVVANGRLYLRDQDVLLCYDVKGK